LIIILFLHLGENFKIVLISLKCLTNKTLCIILVQVLQEILLINYFNNN